MQRKVLIVDHDVECASDLRSRLEKAGLQVQLAADGLAGMSIAREQSPDLALLELFAPEVDGNTLCRTLRMNRDTAAMPIVILASDDLPGERERSFASGADDYVVKPFNPDELVLRVQAFLRWSRSAPGGRNVLRVDQFVVDSDALNVYLEGQRLDLTITELRLLLFLLSDPGRFQSRKSLVRSVWGHKTLRDSRAVDTCMRRLREKVGAHATRFETLRGVGYRYITAQAE